MPLIDALYTEKDALNIRKLWKEDEEARPVLFSAFGRKILSGNDGEILPAESFKEVEA